VDRLGFVMLEETLKLGEPLYRLSLEPFVSTSDTLVGDPKYGFPCPWLTTHHQAPSRGFDAYHSSVDTLELLSPEGLALCTTAVAGYLYYLADAGTQEALGLIRAETDWTLEQITAGGKRPDGLCVEHRTSVQRLKRWLWGGVRAEALGEIAQGEQQVRGLDDGCASDAGMGEQILAPGQPVEPGVYREQTPLRPAVGVASSGAAPSPAAPISLWDSFPRRTAPLTPDWDYNAPPELAARVRKSGISPWTLFRADGNHSVMQIARMLSDEYGRPVGVEEVHDFFQAHAGLGYVELIEAEEAISQGQLETDLRTLGLEAGMDVMVHSSLSRIGHVIGGADTVIDALLAVIGSGGTVMMPSFNHGAARVFNPLTTPTTNGAIPDAFWRRADAVRSLHPTHAVAAIGAKAEQYCAGHLEAGIWAADSPIGRLIHGGGFILSLGVTHESSTAYHVAEISVPCSCIDQFGKSYRVVMPDGAVREVRGLAWRSAACPVPPGRLDEALDARGLQRHGRVGRADATLVRAQDLWNARREHLKDFCPTCTIRPES
jgi:aminoglycoside 3-N-acetyltransferase